MNEDSRLTQWAHEMLTEAGIRPETADLLDQAIILLLIVLIAWAADLVCRFLILGVGKRIAAQADKKWKGVLVERSVLRKFSDLIPVILVYLLIPLAFPARSHTPAVLQTICLVYVIFIIIMLLNALLKVTFAFLNRRDEMHDRPLKGMLQILQVSLFFVGGIVIIGLIVGRSPLHLLAGLGASAAILMLIFKDSILGFVSGIMLSANKMLKPGDWISMPKYNVDGTVLEVTLNTVKIENFDNTITTIPPFVLTGDSFKNWRWMEESGGRRIMRSISIDMSSVRFCTPEAIERYRKIPLVNDFIAEHEKKAETSAQTGPDGARQAALYRLTNLTLFRAYLNNYLKALSVVNKELTCMVRHLQPTPTGIPIEIYCFSSIKEWVAYEGVQADLFDHVIAVVPDFDLVLFQSPAGTDLQRWMQPQPAPETVRSADAEDATDRAAASETETEDRTNRTTTSDGTPPASNPQADERPDGGRAGSRGRSDSRRAETISAKDEGIGKRSPYHDRQKNRRLEKHESAERIFRTESLYLPCCFFSLSTLYARARRHARDPTRTTQDDDDPKQNVMGRHSGLFLPDGGKRQRTGIRPARPRNEREEKRKGEKCWATRSSEGARRSRRFGPRSCKTTADSKRPTRTRSVSDAGAENPSGKWPNGPAGTIWEALLRSGRRTEASRMPTKGSGSSDRRTER